MIGNNDLKSIIENQQHLFNIKLEKLERKFKSLEEIVLKICHNDEIYQTKFKELAINEKVVVKEEICKEMKEDKNKTYHYGNLEDQVDNCDTIIEIKELIKFIIRMIDDMKDRMDLLDLEVSNNYKKNNLNTNDEDPFYSILDNSKFIK
jgi:hypothetical protein